MDATTVGTQGHWLLSTTRLVAEETDEYNKCKMWFLFDLNQHQDNSLGGIYAGAEFKLKVDDTVIDGTNGSWTTWHFSSFSTEWSTASSYATMTAIQPDGHNIDVDISFNPADLSPNDVISWDLSDRISQRIIDGTVSANGKITVCVLHINGAPNQLSTSHTPTFSWDNDGGKSEMDKVTFYDHDGSQPFALVLYYFPTGCTTGIGPGFG